MKIQVDHLLSKDFTEINETFSKIELFEGARLAGPVIFQGILKPIENDEISLDGKLSAKLVIKCSQCLESFEENMDIKIIEAFYPSYVVNGASKEDGFGDLSRFTYDSNSIDLDKIIRDNLVAAIPPHFLCPNCEKKE